MVSRHKQEYEVQKQSLTDQKVPKENKAPILAGIKVLQEQEEQKLQKKIRNSPRHPERSEGSPCSGTISNITIDINRSIQDLMY